MQQPSHSPRQSSLAFASIELDETALQSVTGGVRDIQTLSPYLSSVFEDIDARDGGPHGIDWGTRRVTPGSFSKEKVAVAYR